MHVVKDDTQFLTPGQTPVLGMDQPIYAIEKLIQWKWCNTDLIKDTFALMFGTFHIEFVIGAIEGKFTEGSGMAAMVCKAGIFTADLVPFHYFIPLRGVIPYLHSWGLVKGLHGQYGTHFLT